MIHNSHKLITAWLPVLLWCGVIFFFSSLSTIETHLIIWYDVLVKKMAHVIEFAILAILFYRALKMTEGKTIGNKNNFVLATLIFCFVYAMSDEFHQSFTPGRQPNVYDVGIDVIGIISGLLVITRWKRLQQTVLRFKI